MIFEEKKITLKKRQNGCPEKSMYSGCGKDVELYKESLW